MKSVKRMIVLGMVMVLLSTVHSAIAQTQSPCSILIVGQSLAQGVYGQHSGIAAEIDNADFKTKTKCSSVNFVDGATGSSAADCAITRQDEDEDRPINCWINHRADYNGGERYGNAFREAHNQIKNTMNNATLSKRRRIIAIIWSQGERDSSYAMRTVPGLITEPANLCSGAGVYCKAAYKNNVAEILGTLRAIIADYLRTNFQTGSDGEDIPVFIPVIGRRAFPSSTSASSIAKLSLGIKTIREAQYEIVKEGVNISIAALGYDQPLQAIIPPSTSQVHPTDSGYLQTARRLGFAIRSYFDNNPYAYVGPKVLEARWESADIAVIVAHSMKTSMPSAPSCTAPTYCGFVVLDGGVSRKINVIKDGTLSSVNGLKRTKYRIQLLEQLSGSRTELAFALGAMNELNVPRIVSGGETNEAKNILTQKCLSTATMEECGQHENTSLPVQPAFFSSSSRSGPFSNQLNDLPLVPPGT